jgi:K+/H+ antiporter YhaU regulatory subunit KhtT
VVRDGTLHQNPGVEFRFAQGDLVAVIGTSDQFDVFQRIARQSAERRSSDDQ